METIRHLVEDTRKCTTLSFTALKPVLPVEMYDHSVRFCYLHQLPPRNQQEEEEAAVVVLGTRDGSCHVFPLRDTPEMREFLRRVKELGPRRYVHGVLRKPRTGMLLSVPDLLALAPSQSSDSS